MRKLLILFFNLKSSIKFYFVSYKIWNVFFFGLKIKTFLPSLCSKAIFFSTRLIAIKAKPPVLIKSIGIVISSIPFICLGGDNEKINHIAEAAIEMNLTCNDLKKDLNLSDGDVVDMLQLVMDRFKNRNSI